MTTENVIHKFCEQATNSIEKALATKGKVTRQGGCIQALDGVRIDLWVIPTRGPDGLANGSLAVRWAGGTYAPDLWGLVGQVLAWVSDNARLAGGQKTLFG